MQGAIFLPPPLLLQAAVWRTDRRVSHFRLIIHLLTVLALLALTLKPYPNTYDPNPTSSHLAVRPLLHRGL